MDQIEQFREQLSQIINNSNFPASVIKMVLQNVLLEIQIIELQNKFKQDEEKLENINE